MRMLVRILIEEDATTSVEYAVVLALILVAIISAIAGFGDEAAGMWDNIDTRVAPLLSSPDPPAG